jgi:hypothetical protein
MRGRTFDPFASLAYAARLMAAHIEFRNSDYVESLIDYNVGRGASAAARERARLHYAAPILEGLDMASTDEIEAVRAESDRRQARMLGALHQLGEVIQVANRVGEQAAGAEDWATVKEAERFYHDG